MNYPPEFVSNNDPQLHLDCVFMHDCHADKLHINPTDINKKSVSGWTPLELAAIHGKIKMCKKLLNAGALINNVLMNTVAYSGTMNNNKMVKFLISQGANVNDNINSIVVLDMAVSSTATAGSIETVKILLDAGAQMDDNSLFIAVCMKNSTIETAKLLINRGADICILNKIESKYSKELDWCRIILLVNINVGYNTQLQIGRVLKLIKQL